ncbi:hypothetical protein KQX54_000390 [Cotesia glomerata]|uniref:Uncharacterized protein n=1 Tax=Cotesia glomerata TaxID=32391 RepID=A0AAV7IYH9_COTGL|nr:hypothetical protein KQX54_000390 [Cotesia glomerata]
MDRGRSDRDYDYERFRRRILCLKRELNNYRSRRNRKRPPIEDRDCAALDINSGERLVQRRKAGTLEKIAYSGELAKS